MEPTKEYDAINLHKIIYHEVAKKSQLGAPEELNYAAMIISTFVGYIERIPTIKGLVKRLRDDITFMLNCSFLQYTV